jgi:uncharacterized membrane protein YqjE
LDSIEPAVGNSAAATAVDVLSAARILRAAGGALWTQAGLHAELARIEWVAEKQRLLRQLMLAALVLVLAIGALFAAGALLLVIAWDTPWRLAAAIALPLLYAVAAAVVAWRLRVGAVRAAPAFAATRQELAADLALLRSRL